MTSPPTPGRVLRGCFVSSYADPSPRHLSPDALFVRACREKEMVERERKSVILRDATFTRGKRRKTVDRPRRGDSVAHIDMYVPARKARPCRGLLLNERFLAVLRTLLPAVTLILSTICSREGGLQPSIYSIYVPSDYPTNRRSSRL